MAVARACRARARRARSASACTRSSGSRSRPATVIAFLTILGFSIYDTIVVFDKVHENTRRILATGQVDLRRHGEPVAEPGADAVAEHVAQRRAPVLSLLVVGSILLGATTLEEFGLALLVGLISGAYSSIFIATPILAVLKEREPRYKALKAKFGSTTVLSTLPAATAVADSRLGRVAHPHGICDRGRDCRRRPAATASGVSSSTGGRSAIRRDRGRRSGAEPRLNARAR